MACFHPWKAFLPLSGQGRPVSKWREGYCEDVTLFPCGSCDGCRSDRSRDWSIRIMEHSKSFNQNCFVTLTYDEDHVPVDGSLCKRDVQLFFKRVRKKYEQRISYFYCGEYGEFRGRPHYHICFFNLDFSDKVFSELSASGLPQFSSPSLDKLWKFGRARIGDLTIQSAAYVARYVLKKQRDDMPYLDVGTGSIRLKEYCQMSQGIGYQWFEKNLRDVFPKDYIFFEGQKYRVPRYFNNKFKEKDPVAYEEVKQGRIERAQKLASDNTPERLLAREFCFKEKRKRLRRGFENGK